VLTILRKISIIAIQIHKKVKMPTIIIPDSLCSSIHPDYNGDNSTKEVVDTIRLAVKKMIEGAIRDELQPAPLPAVSEAGLAQNITFPALESRIIRALSKQEGISEAYAAKRYLLAALARGDALAQRKDPISEAFQVFLDASKKSTRHAQSVFFDCLNDSLENEKVGLIEGATGIGKTLAMIAAATTSLQRVSFGRAVITTPTIQLMRQFAGQHRELASRMEMPEGRFILGRQEFVSDQALRQVISEGKLTTIDPLPILEWLDKGALAVGQNAIFEHRYLADSLSTISSEFPLDVVRLTTNTDTSDPGFISYKEQFAREEDASSQVQEIIYCTHAMIAVDIRRRISRSYQGCDTLNQESTSKMVAARKNMKDGEEKTALGKEIRDAIMEDQDRIAEYAKSEDLGHLPPWQFILVDEAHLFEQNLATALSDYFSVASFISDLKELAGKGLITATSVSRAKAAFGVLQQCAPTGKDDIDLSQGSTNAQQAKIALKDLIDSIKLKKNGKDGVVNPLVDRINRTVSNLRRVLNQSQPNSAWKCMVKFSPVRQYPQVYFGKTSINSELYFLWATALGAACVSATLYIRRMDTDSASFYQRILNIPDVRVREYPPIRPAWVDKPVKELWSPERIKLDTGALWLSPPSRMDKLSESKHKEAESVWLDQVAEEVKSIHASAAGGVLVLMTSYDAADGLSSRIGDTIPFKVVASTGNPLSSQKHRFIQLSQAGERPLWIALGGAWTGLDVNGAELGIKPEDDNLLTDLVIPRIPFSLNRAMTHIARMNSLSKVPWELLDTAMRFKQGIGRLVRREGLKNNRRIFILDGRVNDARFTGYLSLLQRMMNIYTVKKLIKK